MDAHARSVGTAQYVYRAGKESVHRLGPLGLIHPRVVNLYMGRGYIREFEARPLILTLALTLAYPKPCSDHDPEPALPTPTLSPNWPSSSLSSRPILSAVLRVMK